MDFLKRVGRGLSASLLLLLSLTSGRVHAQVENPPEKPREVPVKQDSLTNPVLPVMLLPPSVPANPPQEADEGASSEASYIHGDFQSDAQYYVYEPKLLTQKYSEFIGNNSYFNLLYDRGNLSAGLRFENYQPPLLGFDQRLKGTGIPFRFINYKWKELSVTVGNFYEQFGNGLIYRSYWEYGLGFDNSVDGVRIRYNLLEGIQIKAFAGKQRFFFEKGPGIVRGADIDLSLNGLIPSLELSPTKITTGFGAVSKYQIDDDLVLKLPENVAAVAGRFRVSRKKWNVESEYAWKANDPSGSNQKIYRPGTAFLIQGGYSTKGFGASVGAKRIDNFDFRSDRSADLNNLLINYLPPLSPQHTYRLATLYPYATQPRGEMGAQADIFFKAPEGSLAGGKYGTNFTFNYCRINAIQKTLARGADSAVRGYTSDFFSIGKDIYYQNLSLEVSRKLSPRLKLICSYIFIEADNEVLRISNTVGVKTIKSHIGVVDLSWKVKARHTLRAEAQNLTTHNDNGSWAMLLFEYQMGSHFFFALYDEYNYGNPKKEQRIHYLGGSVGYTKGTVRITLNGGRQRAGVFCVGGVCRFVPASSGVSASVSASF